MAISRQHERLVGHIIRWIERAYSSRGDLCIYADHIDWPSNHRPAAIGGFVPDVYAVGMTEALTIIGEAETSKGIEKAHTRNQIAAFIDFLVFEVNPVLVVAVPWDAVPAARNLVRNVLRSRGYPYIETVFLERLL